MRCRRIDRSIPGATSFRNALLRHRQLQWRCQYGGCCAGLGSVAEFQVRDTKERWREACWSSARSDGSIHSRALIQFSARGALQTLEWISGSRRSYGGSSPRRLGSWKSVLIKMRAEHEPLRQGPVQRGPGARVSRLDGSGCPGLCKPAPRRSHEEENAPELRELGGDVRPQGHRLAGLQPDGERRFDVAAVGSPHRQAIAGAEHGDEVSEGGANEFLDGGDVDDRGAVGTNEPGG